MKIMKRMIMSLLVVIFITSHIYAAVPQGGRPKEDPEVLSVRHQAIFINQWMSAGDSIFSQTKNPKVKEIMDFLWERGVIGVLTKKDIYLIVLRNEVPVSKRIILIATKEEDKKRDAYLEAVWEVGLELDKFFGPAKTEFERQSRVDAIWFHTFFNYSTKSWEKGRRENRSFCSWRPFIKKRAG